ncbi:hypothetical protein NDU88_002366 [Pleurodeles waltl]|uniref:Uncharacterized protein n=1 Tax=Pleurodeles waltl TaxID=8319 RepID=A0AAV7MSJ4_PLEWA|nr:hypothetical protein NDU88_002366 [Pleurodeles waltl]
MLLVVVLSLGHPCSAPHRSLVYATEPPATAPSTPPSPLPACLDTPPRIQPRALGRNRDPERHQAACECPNQTGPAPLRVAPTLRIQSARLRPHSPLTGPAEPPLRSHPPGGSLDAPGRQENARSLPRISASHRSKAQARAHCAASRGPMRAAEQSSAPHRTLPRPLSACLITPLRICLGSRNNIGESS